MGEGTSRVNRTPEDLEREVRDIRQSMDPVLQELDVRRHELTDWKLQLRRHGPTLMKAGAVVAGMFVAVGVAVRVAVFVAVFVALFVAVFVAVFVGLWVAVLEIGRAHV